MKPNLRQLSKPRLDFIKPMLAKPAAQLPAGSNWLYELKLDGYRTLALKQRNVVTLFSRRGNIMNLHFPTIATACSFLPNDTIVDGEVVVLDHSGKPSFSALQHSRFTPDALYFYIFDLLAYEGKDGGLRVERNARSGALVRSLHQQSECADRSNQESRTRRRNRQTRGEQIRKW
jgi:ATP-dependent DNA ligase